jgi:hypothetical protein
LSALIPPVGAATTNQALSELKIFTKKLHYILHT